ncbi:hypothetical protein F5Y18DRAFT_373925 [Xylariaceae sp. FL1019]|nr:hypothetical protein F5Y18DRAFT_373925 [Xylariaceae sp. FL1019]
MGLYTKLPTDVVEVDVIIVGAGCSGCILASRLADADPDLSILLIESGTDNHGLAVVDNAGLWFSHIQPGSPHTKFFRGPKSEPLAGRQATVPVGQILGGGTSVNSVLYSRAQRSDIDAWNMPGWSPDEFLSYMKKFETFHGSDPHGKHGSSGPMQVSRGRHRNHRLEDDFITTLSKLGWPELGDINCFGPTNGAMRAMRYLDPEGRRQDTATLYLRPRLEDGQHPNLHVLLESEVERVLFKNNRAVGVSFRPNPTYHPDADPESRRTLKAKKLVVLCGGTLSSPMILERSGVGSRDILERVGVPVVSDVAGVGNNYQDHQSMMYPYHSSLAPEDTLDAIHSGLVDVGDLIKTRDGRLTYNAIDVQAKLRPNEADVDALGAAFRDAWDENFKDIPDKPLMMLSPVSAFPGDPSAFGPQQFFTLVTFTLYPFSRGHIHITGPKIDDEVDFDPGLLSDPKNLDVSPHVWMYKLQRKLAAQMSCCQGPVDGTYPTFPPESQAHQDSPNIEYSAADDAVIEKWIREHIDSTWHPLGTCKMAPNDEGGVVDESLGVYGVEGLKVADISLAPHNVGANLASTAMAIAEKAADIFIKELTLERR